MKNRLKYRLFCALFEFPNQCRESGLFSGGGIPMDNPLGTCLIECLYRVSEELVGIFGISSQHCFHDIFATVPNKRPAGTVPFPGGDILTKPLFGTCNVGHVC